MANSELPRRANTRGGPGWWMDLDGAWRAPEEWPEDTPPIDGWVRDADGSWGPSTVTEEVEAEDVSEQPRIRTAVLERQKPPEQPRSRQAQADRKAMFAVAGALGAAALVLVAALILITQAGADGDPEAEVGGAVIFAADTEQVRMERRMAMTVTAPDVAREQLAQLASTDPAVPVDELLSSFDPLAWSADLTDCLDISEKILIIRSRVPVGWADQLECVPNTGQWHDRYLGSTMSRSIDVDVRLHVPAAIAFASGAAQWTEATTQAYVADVLHPATLEVTQKGGGHNPRNEGPAQWKPSDSATWCAYAIDWVAVKTRWQLTVTDAERAALVEMLDTCGTAASSGPDPYSMSIDPLSAPRIEFVSSE